MPKNKYRKWLDEVAGLMHEDANYMRTDPTYDYNYLYNAYPQDRQQIIKDLKENDRAHFRDAAKTAKHPTFSVESDFNGKFDLIHNPRGIEGGTWSDAPHLGPRASRYTLSESQVRNNWDIDNTLDYIINAEDQGAEVVYPKGKRLTLDGATFGGVLPAITVKPKRSKRKLGGLSRSDDYGSSKKPYPNVKSSDFAGGGRSYPIPTRADAVDALRLAGLHGRSDVRAKVYKKYPDLKK